MDEDVAMDLGVEVHREVRLQIVPRPRSQPQPRGQELRRRHGRGGDLAKDEGGATSGASSAPGDAVVSQAWPTSVRCSPRPSMPTRMTLPDLRNTGLGLTPAPTPGGVPVLMTSPGSRVT